MSSSRAITSTPLHAPSGWRLAYCDHCGARLVLPFRATTPKFCEDCALAARAEGLRRSGRVRRGRACPVRDFDTSGSENGSSQDIAVRAWEDGE